MSDLDDNWHWLRHHLLCARNYAYRLSLELGEDGNPDPNMAAHGNQLEVIADRVCPAQENWGGGNVLPFRPRMKTG
jgi:hypothetical protein